MNSANCLLFRCKIYVIVDVNALTETGLDTLQKYHRCFKQAVYISNNNSIGDIIKNNCHLQKLSIISILGYNCFF